MAGDPIVAQGMHVHAPKRAGYPVSDRCGRAGDRLRPRAAIADQDADKSPSDFRFQAKLGSKAGVVERPSLPPSRQLLRPFERRFITNASFGTNATLSWPPKRIQQFVILVGDLSCPKTVIHG